MRCNARHPDCAIYHGPWQTPSGKWAARNKNRVIRYLDTRRKANAFRHTATGKRRDYSAERYERRRMQFLADFKKDPKGSGYLGNLSSAFPPADSPEAREIVFRAFNN